MHPYYKPGTLTIGVPQTPGPVVAQGRYEPSLSMVKLPRCPNPACSDPVHPLARDGWHEPKTCPGCGGPAAQIEALPDVEDVMMGVVE